MSIEIQLLSWPLYRRAPVVYRRWKLERAERAKDAVRERERSTAKLLNVKSEAGTTSQAAERQP